MSVPDQKTWPQKKSRSKLPIQNPHSQSPFKSPNQNPHSKFQILHSKPLFKIPIQNPYSKPLFKTFSRASADPHVFGHALFENCVDFQCRTHFLLEFHWNFWKNLQNLKKNAFSQLPRAVNMVYQLPAISNLPYTLFLILNENLTPTYHYSAGILRANFHKNYLNDALLHLKKKIKRQR